MRNFSTWLIVFLVFFLLGIPFALRPKVESPKKEVRSVIIISPHNEQIREEFGQAFEKYHLKKFNEPVHVVWSVPGGTSEIRKMLVSQFETALKEGRTPGRTADLIFGGGTYEHGVLKKGVTVEKSGKKITSSISQPADFTKSFLNNLYGENKIGSTLLYDPEQYWLGTCLSSFGIVSNLDVLSRLNISSPMKWEDLCSSKLFGFIGLANPAQSGSVSTAYQSILDHLGWEKGWQVLRRAAANARGFSGSSLRGPSDVSRGDAAMAVCIDFYGKYQSQAILDSGGKNRLSYVDPKGETTIDSDPISIMKNPRDPELAKRFIEFVLSEKGQSLWDCSKISGDQEILGPSRFELRRMPIVRSFYEKHFDKLIDKTNPFKEITEPENMNKNHRSFIAPLFLAMAIDRHDKMRQAWETIIMHPAYPKEKTIVTSKDVSDPKLRKMLRLFDFMPVVPSPNGLVQLQGAENLSVIKSGWLKGGWFNWAVEEGILSEEDRIIDVFRQLAGKQFESVYQEIISLEQEG